MTLNILTTKKRNLIRAFAVLDEWFDKEEAFQRYKPPGHIVSIRDVLEQVVITADYMTTLIDSKHIGGEFIFDSVTACRFFAAMQAKNNLILSLKSSPELRTEFRHHLNRCLCNLELIETCERPTLELKVKNDLLFQCLELLELCLLQYAGQLNKIEEKYLIQPA